MKKLQQYCRRHIQQNYGQVYFQDMEGKEQVMKKKMLLEGYQEEYPGLDFLRTYINGMVLNA
ncbi:unnamed protein product [Paramecium sonneborni]|uniref:Uncharacterized protein n=1 Tax=Paramecium sonneborni TaxID=65129 RepID=A0A8S1MUN5_9CILI|nr:unnamed protein product [Paramecium sonneborni]